MQSKDKYHRVSFDQFDLIYEDDVLTIYEDGDSFTNLTPEVARQIKMVIDLFLIDQYQV